MSCWQRLRNWQKVGLREQLYRALLRCLSKTDQIDWSRACIDAGSVLAAGWGEKTGPNPTVRRKSGLNCHLVADRRGFPLAVRHTLINVCDITMLLEMVDAIPQLPGPDGQFKNRPEKLHADRGFDSNKHRQALEERGIIPRLGRRRIDQGVRLGKHRWVVERTLAWLNRYRRLRVRYERRDDIHQAFLSLGCAMICSKFVQRFS